MGTIAINLHDEQDQQLLVQLLAKAIRGALDEVAVSQSNHPPALPTAAQSAQKQLSLMVDVETVESMLGVFRRYVVQQPADTSSQLATRSGQPR